MLKSYRDQISTLTSSMTENQLKVVDSEIADERVDETEADEPAPVTVNPPVFSKKYVALGFVMGIFLAALYLVCVAVLSNKLQQAEELVRFYKLRQFGILTQGKGSEGITGFLLRIKYRNQKMLSAEAAMRETLEAGHVVLVEITDVSIYQEIEKELCMLKDWNVDIAGCVGVE